MGLFNRKPVCRKFFTYETKTLDISGLSAGLTKSELAQFNFSLGQFKLSPEFVKVSDMLMLKDLQQYDLCQTISNISDRAERDKLFVELVKIKMEMMRMADNPEAYQPQKTNTQNMETKQYSINVEGDNNIIIQGVEGSNQPKKTSIDEIICMLDKPETLDDALKLANNLKFPGSDQGLFNQKMRKYQIGMSDYEKDSWKSEMKSFLQKYSRIFS